MKDGVYVSMDGKLAVLGKVIDRLKDFGALRDVFIGKDSYFMIWDSEAKPVFSTWEYLGGL